MTRIGLVLGLLAATGPGIAQASQLLCLGVTPRFVLTAQGSGVTFDYNGDGTYLLEPPLRTPGMVYQRHVIVTHAARWPLVLDTRDCRVSTLTLPVRVEVRVPTDTGTQRFLGCCLWKDAP